MKKEKQIEEMAKVLCCACTPDGDCSEDGKKCDLDCWAYVEGKQLYNAGYRKQSEPISCGHENGGEWIQSRSKFGFGQSNCSICNGYVDGYTSYKYCPHCGTKIQGIRSKEDDEQ
jgi:hypothetical protein